MSTIARSGPSSRTRSIRSKGVPHWPATSKPDRSSKPASPSRRRTSSSARTTRVRLVLMASIMRYLDTMGTFARPADHQAKNRVEPGRLAEEQAALRRVATLVARGASSREVFEAVAREVAEVLQLANAAVCRYDDQGTMMTVLAVWADHPDVFSTGSRWPLQGH